MNRPILRRLSLCTALVAVALAFRAGCQQGPPVTSWNCPRMLDVKQEWQALHDSFAGPWTKSNYEERTAELDGILQKRLSHQDMAALAATCGEIPVDESDWSDFEHSAMRALLDTFVTSGDRENLVTLLSNRCPTRYCFMEIEDYLTRIGKQRFKDPVLILGEACSKCQDPQVRKVIGLAVRQGFKGYGIYGNNDAEFVQAAMRWYEQEKDHLVLDPEYGGRWDPLHFNRPLFKWTGPSPPKPAWMQTFGQFSQPAQQKALGEITNSIGMKFVLIPPGNFIMGSADHEQARQASEHPRHPVRITKTFSLGVYEVTETEFEQVMGKQTRTAMAQDRRPGNLIDTTNFPVGDVSWNKAAEFCNRLSAKEGFPAYYRFVVSKRGEPWKDVELLGGPGYRLPTEAEWEYACRAGTTTPFSFGKTIESHQANVAGRSSFAMAVGSFPPNAFGLHDMHGNFYEWCNDAYDPRYYEESPIDDPPGPPGPSALDPTDFAFRGSAVARGGCWASPLQEARSASRLEAHRAESVGFRVARNRNNSGD